MRRALSAVIALLAAIVVYAISAHAEDAKPSAPPAAAKPASPATAAKPAPLPIGSRARCPVSGEEFTVKKNTVQVTHNGKSYGFCCADCLDDWKKDPAGYARKAEGK